MELPYNMGNNYFSQISQIIISQTIGQTYYTSSQLDIKTLLLKTPNTYSTRSFLPTAQHSQYWKIIYTLLEAKKSHQPHPAKNPVSYNGELPGRCSHRCNRGRNVGEVTNYFLNQIQVPVHEMEHISDPATGGKTRRLDRS